MHGNLCVDRITIGGLGGVGKGEVIKGIKATLGFTAVSTGQFFRALAGERGMTLKDFELLAKENLDIDRELDRRMETFGRENGRIVVDGRLAHRNIPSAFKVFLTCDDPVRFARMAERDGRPVEEVAGLEADRERALLARFQTLYGIRTMDELFPLDLFPSQGGFHVKIDTTRATAEQVVNMILVERGRYL